MEWWDINSVMYSISGDQNQGHLFDGVIVPMFSHWYMIEYFQ